MELTLPVLKCLAGSFCLISVSQYDVQDVHFSVVISLASVPAQPQLFAGRTHALVIPRHNCLPPCKIINTVNNT